MKNLEKLSILEIAHYIAWCEAERASTKELDLNIAKMRTGSDALDFERLGLPDRVKFLDALILELKAAKRKKEISDLGLDQMLEFSYNFSLVEYAQLNQQEKKEAKEKAAKEFENEIAQWKRK